MVYDAASQFYDSLDFDAERNAIEGGFDNVPLYYADAVGGFGETPPSITVSRGDTIVQNGPLIWIALGVILYLLWR